MHVRNSRRSKRSGPRLNKHLSERAVDVAIDDGARRIRYLPNAQVIEVIEARDAASCLLDELPVRELVADLEPPCAVALFHDLAEGKVLVGEVLSGVRGTW